MTDILVGSGVGGDVDERLVAKASLDAAEEQLQSLCASHAGTFVSVERRGQALESALTDLQASIKDVESQLATVQKSLEQDEDNEKSLASLSEKHRVRRRTLLQHSSLLELLELPSLMDACVRSNLYEEALSIAAFSNTLERRHTERNEVVLKVIAQVRSRQGDLRRHLLHSLRSHVTMPQCLEIVTALRRLNAIDLERQSEKNLERVHSAMELSLQVDFLEARDAWLEMPTTSSSGTSRFSSAMDQLGKGPVTSSEQLLDTIERYRTRVFEIATQFNAIFRAQKNAQTVSFSLVSMWASRRIHSFLAMLTVQLNRMEDSASLRDALDACVFFAASMGRLGADFTAQLQPLFENKMHALVVDNWKEGINQLSETLKLCREAGVASPLTSTSHLSNPSDSADGATETSENATTTTGSTGPMPPPRQLMALPPLARLVNAFLAGLNELRRCLLPGIFLKLRNSLKETLTEVETILQTNERAVLKPGLRGDALQLRQAASEMKDVMATIVDPYIRGALELALGNDAAAAEFHAKLNKAMEEPKKDEVPTEIDDDDVNPEEGIADEPEAATADEPEAATSDANDAEDSAPQEGANEVDQAETKGMDDTFDNF